MLHVIIKKARNEDFWYRDMVGQIVPVSWVTRFDYMMPNRSTDKNAIIPGGIAREDAVPLANWNDTKTRLIHQEEWETLHDDAVSVIKGQPHKLYFVKGRGTTLMPVTIIAIGANFDLEEERKKKAWIYTIGHKSAYEAAYKEFGALTKTGKTESYAGGYAFRTQEEAQAFVDEAAPEFAVFPMLADWETETEPSKDGRYHHLLVDSPIIPFLEEDRK